MCFGGVFPANVSAEPLLSGRLCKGLGGGLDHQLLCQCKWTLAKDIVTLPYIHVLPVHTEAARLQTRQALCTFLGYRLLCARGLAVTQEMSPDFLLPHPLPRRRQRPPVSSPQGPHMQPPPMPPRRALLHYVVTALPHLFPLTGHIFLDARWTTSKTDIFASHPCPPCVLSLKPPRPREPSTSWNSSLPLRLC